MEGYENLSLLVQKGRMDEVEQAVNELLNERKTANEIIENGIIAALDIVGKDFSDGTIFIPEMLVAARTSQKILDILKPLLVKEKSEPKGKIVIGTVKGDMHDIGKNIVSTIFESSSFKVTDLGIDVSPEKFIQAIREFKPQIVAMSCLLTTTMNSMRETIEEIREQGLRGSVTIMVGGPPISTKFADEIGADFYGKDAYSAVQAAREFVDSKKRSALRT